ncbi:bcl-2-related ovarian killer protein-like [Prorops nasuta]|uniref:bcl-2-related ovarian killer protein-like n=1 Tax=Prorops nasuta TaxID=863751 RepID=UPI0034CDC258
MDNTLQVPSGLDYRRRSSLALSLHSNLAGFYANNNNNINNDHGKDTFPFHVVGSARRRLSNVGDAVSRKISHTIGWRTVPSSITLTVSQGSSLCAQYIRNRLKRSGIFQRKIGLKRMRSAMLLPGGSVVGEVYPELISVGSELEKMYPNLFERIGRQIGCGHFSSDQAASEAMTDVSREILRNGEITWSKVIALYAVAGGIALDCVRQAKPEYITAVQRAMTEVLEEDLATWIQANGGWEALITRYRQVPKETPWHTRDFLLLFTALTIFIGTLLLCIKIVIF